MNNASRCRLNPEFLRRYVSGFESGASDLKRSGLDWCLENRRTRHRQFGVGNPVWEDAYIAAILGKRQEWTGLDYINSKYGP